MSKITDHQLIGLHILFSFSRSSSSSFSPSFLSLLLLRPSLDWNASATFNLWMNETIFAGSALVAALALVKSFTWYVLNRVRGILDTQLVETIEIKSMTSERYVRVRFNISNRKFNKDRENIFAIQSMECKLPTVCWHIPHIVYSRRRRRFDRSRWLSTLTPMSSSSRLENELTASSTLCTRSIPLRESYAVSRSAKFT